MNNAYSVSFTHQNAARKMQNLRFHALVFLVSLQCTSGDVNFAKSTVNFTVIVLFAIFINFV